MKENVRIIAQCFLLTCLAHATTMLLAALPDESLNLKLSTPIRTWDGALPLGNGLGGAVLWGETL